MIVRTSQARHLNNSDLLNPTKPHDAESELRLIAFKDSDTLFALFVTQ